MKRSSHNRPLPVFFRSPFKGLILLLLLFVACARPLINSFTPNMGINGTSVTLQGNWLVANSNPGGTVVKIGDVQQTITTASNTQIEFNVAPGSQTGFIKVINGHGQ